MSKTLVAYFSASGVTEKVAKNLAEAAGADIYKINPALPYSESDLDWRDKSSRSSVEMTNKTIRPELDGSVIDITEYEKVYLGFPIWWYVAPTIINTFLEANDFSGKKIVVFATSGGSKFGNTVKELKPSVSESTEIIEGEILNGNPDKEKLKLFAEKY